MSGRFEHWLCFFEMLEAVGEKCVEILFVQLMNTVEESCDGSAEAGEVRIIF